MPSILKYPIGIITLFLALGIIAGHYANLPSTIVYIFFGIAFAALCISFLQSKKSFLPLPRFSFAVLAFSFLLGLLIQAIHYTPNQKLHYSHLITDETTLINGVISERLKPNDFAERYYFEVCAVNKIPAKGKILLTSPKDSLHTILHSGDSFIINGSLTPIAKPTNPYQFDYASYMAKQGIFHQLKLENNYIKTGTVQNFDFFLGNLREKLIESFEIHHFSPSVQNTLNALLLGQRQDMDKATNDAYKDAGVLHILAISGLHFAMLFYLLTLLLKPLDHIQKNGKLLRLITILTIIWTFAFITGLSASVVRSVVMFTIISLGYYLDRDTNIYNSLFISAFILLIANPYFIFDAGFQLSYLAVFSIVALQPLYRRLKPSKYKGINYVTDTVQASFSAQIGVLPLSLYYFNQFPLLFLIANVIVIPLSNVVLVLGLLVLLLNFIWSDAALLFGKVLGILVELMNHFIGLVASFQSFVVKEISFTVVLILLLYITIILSGLWLYQKSYKRTIALLCSVVIFQCAYNVTSWQYKTKEELVVFNNSKNTAIAFKTPYKLTIMSNDSLISKTSAIKTYSRANFCSKTEMMPLQNILWFANKKIMIVDKDAVYIDTIKPDILLLCGSPKINLERLIKEVQPKEIIADATNYKSSIKRFKQTCIKQNIPFHATAEKGYYAIR